MPREASDPGAEPIPPRRTSTRRETRDMDRTGERCCCCFSASRPPRPATDRKTENVILVTTDGLRWQEVFDGADPR